MPEISPFTSAKNTGTPASENASARTFKVIVFPLPVAPAIRPCLFALSSKIYCPSKSEFNPTNTLFSNNIFSSLFCIYLSTHQQTINFS